MLSVIALIVLMTCVGGITRLTGSGLSITEWKPIMGAIPPLNDAEWSEAFFKYQQIPQFKILNSNMNLSEFKFIFFWEFIHRLLGRVIGLVVLIPGLYWIIKKKIQGQFAKQVMIGFLLGGLQGLMGWFMVASGLSELVYVSHFRLAAHFMLAMFVLAYWVNLYLRYTQPATPPQSKMMAPSKRVMILFATQLTYGAFVAGLKAGLGYNTYPKMGDEWIATEIKLNIFKGLAWVSQSAHVQFLHRWLGILLWLMMAFAVMRSRKNLNTNTKTIQLFWIGLTLQIALGIATLVGMVPLALAASHQLVGCLLVIVITVWRRQSMSHA